MRMRKKKNGGSRLAACSEYLFESTGTPMTDPGAYIDRPGAPVLLEIGAGKGGFACNMAMRYPDSVYFAMEKVSDCVVLAAEKAKATFGLENLRFIVDTADNLPKIFDKCTVDRIFLNFSDPWSKKGYAKRRLTHKRYLSVYFNLLKDGGKITFKTDNQALFDFSLQEFVGMGLELDYVTRDLHNSDRSAENVMTEYEKNFSEQGFAINMLEVTKPLGFMPEIPAEFGKSYKNDEK